MAGVFAAPSTLQVGHNLRSVRSDSTSVDVPILPQPTFTFRY